MIAPRVQFSPIAAGYIVIGLAGVAAALWVLNGGARKVAASVAALPGSVAAGAIEGVGSSIGIPTTDQTQCDADLAAARMWSASLTCPASKFIGAVFGSSNDAQAKPVARQADSSGVDTSGVNTGASGSWY